MSATIYTHRDAGLRSTPLKLLNRVAESLHRFGIDGPSLAPDAIEAAARKKAGASDFGGASYREALEVLCESLESEARLTLFGRMVLKGLVVDALSNRLQLIDWAKRHPDVREQKITRPWIIVALPRTGTSLLSILLGLDPAVRPLVQWEASRPVPPPTLAGYAEDPRIAETAKSFEQLQTLNPPIRAMHPFGSTLATECVSLLIFDLRALSIETQAMVPSYGKWLEETDMRGAYEMHELALQVLQSRIPTATWSLKTPNHLWCLETLREFYPDARLIWTHRDPSKVVPSVASLITSLHKTSSNHVDPLKVGREWSDKLHLGVSRGLAFDDAQPAGEPWCSHVLYADLMRDPIGTVRKIYAAHDEELHPLHVQRMEVWMQERGQDVFGLHRYRAEDFGLAREAIRERYKAYIERFDVPEE